MATDINKFIEESKTNNPDFFYIKNRRTNEVLFTSYLPINTFNFSKSNNFQPQTLLKRSSPIQTYTGSEAVSYNFSFTINPIVAAEWSLKTKDGAFHDKTLTIADIYTFFRNLTYPFYVPGGYVKGPHVNITTGPLLDMDGVVTQVSIEFGEDYSFMSGYYDSLDVKRNGKSVYKNTNLFPQVINLQKATITVAVTEVELEPKYLSADSDIPDVRKDAGLLGLVGQSRVSDEEREVEMDKAAAEQALASIYYFLTDEKILEEISDLEGQINYPKIFNLPIMDIEYTDKFYGEITTKKCIELLMSYFKVNSYKELYNKIEGSAKEITSDYKSVVVLIIPKGLKDWINNYYSLYALSRSTVFSDYKYKQPSNFKVNFNIYSKKIDERVLGLKEKEGFVWGNLNQGFENPPSSIGIKFYGFSLSEKATGLFSVTEQEIENYLIKAGYTKKEG